MQMPSNYAEAQVRGEFTPLEIGGHICKIMQVTEMQSKNGLQMLKISLDTDQSDRQPLYYSTQYRNDTREDKKWGCDMYIVTDQSTDYGTKNLKTFNVAVEESNPGYSTVWGDGYANALNGKKVGVVFGREQYLNAKNELKWSVKGKYFRKVDGVLDANVPEDKYLSGNSQPQAQASADGFMSVPDNMPELPFN